MPYDIETIKDCKKIYPGPPLASRYKIKVDKTLTKSGEAADAQVVGKALADIGNERDHSKLQNRDLADQHPISAITDLTEQLDNKLNMTNPVGEGSLSLNRKAESESGDYSVAVGLDNSAIGYASFASGHNTTAGYKSATFGRDTYAGSRAFHVLSLDANNSKIVLDNYEGLIANQYLNFYLINAATNTGNYYGGIKLVRVESDGIVVELPSNSDLFTKYGSLELGNSIMHVAGEPMLGVTATTATAFSSGYLSKAQGQYSFAAGRDAWASGDISFAEGRATRALGFSSHAEGNNTIALNDYSHSEGYQTQANGATSHAEGYRVTVEGTSSHGEGYNVIVNANVAHGEGNNTQALGNASHAEGDRSTAEGNQSHAEGQLTQAQGINSHTEGYNTLTTAENSHAEGASTNALGYASHAEGRNTLASGSDSHSEGLNTVASGTSSHAEGIGTIAEGSNQHVAGKYNIANASALRITGNGLNNESRKNIEQLDTEGNLKLKGSLYINCNDDSTGGQKLVENLKDVGVGGIVQTGLTISEDPKWSEPVSSANGAIALGRGSTASGDFSFAQGKEVVASGGGAVAFGKDNEATGNNAFVTGLSNKANASAATAFGNANTVTGAHSFATGNNNQVSGSQSTTLGDGNISRGAGQFVAGQANTANTAATSAIVLGNNNVVDSKHGVAIGTNLVNGARDDLVVVGRYNNLINVTVNDAFVVGGGTSDSQRQNVFSAGRNTEGASYIKVGGVVLTSAQLQQLLALIQ